MLVSLGAALSLTIGPVARAQDASPGDTPAATPSTFCAVLSADEVSAALKVTVTIQDSSDTNCTYADYTTSFLGLDVRVETGDFATVAPLMMSDGTDTKVGGRDARIAKDGSLMYVDAEQGMLALQLIGTPAAGVDASAALQALGATALSRLGSVPLPTPEPQRPTPSFIGDADLVARFPKTIAGAPLTVQSFSGKDLASIGMNDESLSAITTGLAAVGKTLDDMSLAFGFTTGGEGISAIRIKGVDAATIESQLLPLLLSNITNPVQEPASVAGKNVTKVTDSATYTITYLYTHDDVIWDVQATDPDLTEIFQNLP
jgi:hypothetical protein